MKEAKQLEFLFNSTDELLNHTTLLNSEIELPQAPDNLFEEPKPERKEEPPYEFFVPYECR